MKKILVVLALIVTISLFAQDKFPTFSLENLNGQEVKLNDFLQEGELVLIDFWATWCKPCIKAMPELDKINVDYENVTVIAISTDRPRDINKVKRTIRSKNFSFITLLDSNKELQREINLKNVPRTIVINNQCEILYDHTGFKIGDEQTLRTKLDELLQPKQDQAKKELDR